MGVKVGDPLRQRPASLPADVDSVVCFGMGSGRATETWMDKEFRKVTREEKKVGNLRGD